MLITKNGSSISSILAISIRSRQSNPMGLTICEKLQKKSEKQREQTAILEEKLVQHGR